MEAHEVPPDVVDVLPSNVMKVSFTWIANHVYFYTCLLNTAVVTVNQNGCKVKLIKYSVVFSGKLGIDNWMTKNY